MTEDDPEMDWWDREDPLKGEDVGGLPSAWQCALERCVDSWGCDVANTGCPRQHEAARRAAQAIEARRAETLGSVHESAVRQDAPETGGDHVTKP